MTRRLHAAAAATFLACTLAHAATEMPLRAMPSREMPAREMPSRVLTGTPPAAPSFRASQNRPIDVAALPAPEKRSAPATDERGRLRIATVRSLNKAASVPQWVATPD